MATLSKNQMVIIQDKIEELGSFRFQRDMMENIRTFMNTNPIWDKLRDSYSFTICQNIRYGIPRNSADVMWSVIRNALIDNAIGSIQW